MRSTTIAAIAAALCATTCAAAGHFGQAPQEAPSVSLPSAQVSGGDFHIQDPVLSDGLMHHYVVESRFGSFPALGKAALEVRLREVAALATIARTSDSEVVLKSVVRGMQDDVRTLTQVATNPVGVVLGVPKGIVHLLSGYGARAQEVSQQAGKTLHGKASNTDDQGTGSAASHAASEIKHSATDYASHYLGITEAERRWYAKLQVDPYTPNEVLRRAIQRLAKIDGAAGTAMRFAPIGVPFAGEARRALDTIYNEDPAVLRKRRHDALVSYGLSATEVDRFENAALLNPTRQTLLVNAVESLSGVEGRVELLRHAMSVTTEDEIEVFLESTRMLIQFHAQTPVKSILPGVRVPAARLADGRVAVFGSFDAVYWTQEVARYAGEFHDAVSAQDVAKLDVWLAGAVSPRARQELEARGWSVHATVIQ